MSSAYKFRDPEALYFVTCTVIQWIDLFTRNTYRGILIDSLKYCQENKGLVIHAYCIMSNHIYLIISRKGNPTFSDIMRDFKKHTSKELIKAIKSSEESRRHWMLWIFKSAGERNYNNKDYQVWVQGSHPIQLSSTDFARQRLNYLHNNPVKAGIVYAPENYIYSSASAYCGRLEEALLDLDFLDFQV
ncbi:MAG: putative transposase [Saprospiraceae bacterium]|jgi:putative transposase